MTDESEGSSSAPGSGAGDAAPTQAIPRIPKAAAAKKAPAVKKPAVKAAETKPAPAKAAQTKPVDAKPADTRSTKPAATETDKGRPRKVTEASRETPVAAPAQKPSADRKRQLAPSAGPTGRPLTAADYAHTTAGSPATTSVIPAVKDRPADTRPAAAQERAAEQVAGNAAGRRASLRLTHIEPWSVTRLAFAISVAMMIVAVVAVAIFWVVLDFVGVWDQINSSFTTVLSDNSSSFNVTDYFGLGRVVGLTLVISAVNVILMTALATIAAHLYNVAAKLMGGVEVTFTEER